MRISTHSDSNKNKTGAKEKDVSFVISLHSVLFASSSSSPSNLMSHVLPGVCANKCAPLSCRACYMCHVCFATIAIIKRNILLRAKLRCVSTAQACLHELRVAYNFVRLRSRVCFKDLYPVAECGMYEAVTCVIWCRQKIYYPFSILELNACKSKMVAHLTRFIGLFASCEAEK